MDGSFNFPRVPRKQNLSSHTCCHAGMENRELLPWDVCPWLLPTCCASYSHPSSSSASPSAVQQPKRCPLRRRGRTCCDCNTTALTRRVGIERRAETGAHLWAKQGWAQWQHMVGECLVPESVGVHTSSPCPVPNPSLNFFILLLFLCQKVTIKHRNDLVHIQLMQQHNTAAQEPFSPLLNSPAAF